MSMRARVTTFSGYNHRFYTIRSSIRNQFHMPCSWTQQKDTSSLWSMYLLLSILVTHVHWFWHRICLCFSCFLIAIFYLKNTEHKPSDIWKNFRGCWDHLHMTGYIHAGNSTRHSVERVACPLMCSDRNVDKWNDGDWVCWKRRLRSGMNGDWDKAWTNIFRPSLLNCTSMQSTCARYHS